MGSNRLASLLAWIAVAVSVAACNAGPDEQAAAVPSLSAELRSRNLCERIAATSDGEFAAAAVSSQTHVTVPAYDGCQLNGLRRYGDKIFVGVSALPATGEDLATARRAYDSGADPDKVRSEDVAAGDGAWGARGLPQFVVMLGRARLIRIAYGGSHYTFDDLIDLARTAVDLSAALPATKPVVHRRCESVTAAVEKLLGPAEVRRDQPAATGAVTCFWATRTRSVLVLAGDASSTAARHFDGVHRMGAANAAKYDLERIETDGSTMVRVPSHGLYGRTAAGSFVFVAAEPFVLFSTEDMVRLANAAAPIHRR